MIQCTGCGRWWHTLCGRITVEELTKHAEETQRRKRAKSKKKKKEEETPWFCPNCEGPDAGRFNCPSIPEGGDTVSGDSVPECSSPSSDPLRLTQGPHTPEQGEGEEGPPGVLPRTLGLDLSDSDSEEEEEEGHRPRPTAGSFFRAEMSREEEEGVRRSARTEHRRPGVRRRETSIPVRSAPPGTSVRVQGRQAGEAGAARGSGGAGGGGEEDSGVGGGGGEEGGGGDDHNYTQPREPQDGPAMAVFLPPPATVYGTHIPTFTHIPRTCKPTYNKEAEKLLAAATEKKGENEWLMLAMFSKVILPAVRNRRDDTKSAARVTQSKLERWAKGKYMELWEEAVKDTGQEERGRRKKKPRKGDERTQEQFNADRAKVLAGMGQYSRASQALMSQGMAEDTQQTRDTLQGKFPPAQDQQEHQPQEEGMEAAEFSKEMVAKALKRFKKGSAPGLDGMRAEHLMQAVGNINNARQSKVLGTLTRLVNVMMKGQIPDSVAPYLCGGRLHAALKKGGGIRPIAVGNLLRRLVSRLAVMAVFDQAQELLGSTQVGVGRRGGAESVIHAIKRNIRRYPGLSILQCDLVNAFGESERKNALDLVAEKFPSIYKWAHRSYGGENILFYGDQVITVTKGWLQGDPLSSLMFSLALLPLTEQIKEEVQGLKLHVWFLDDGHMMGTLDQLGRVARIIVERGPTYGLFLSRRGVTIDPKSRIWSKDMQLAEEPIGMGIPVERDEGIVVLGSPVGSVDFERRKIEERIRKVEELTERLAWLEDSHTEFVLLRATLALPKLIYVLRTVDPNPHSRLWEHYDSITRNSLGRIMGGTPITDLIWEQAKMKVGDGGLGLRSALDHSIAAYTASVCNTWELVSALMGIGIGVREEGEGEEVAVADEEDLGEERMEQELGEELMFKLCEAMGRPRDEVTWEELQGLNQHAISVFIDARNTHLMVTKMDRVGEVRDRARIRALQQPNAGAWLCGIPNPKTGAHMCSQEFLLCLQYRMGARIYQEGTVCYGCKKEMDVYGEHAINCGYGRGRVGRHNAVRDIVVDVARSANLSPRVEEGGIIEGTQQRPADVTLPGFPIGRDTLIDVTIVNPLQRNSVEEAAHTAGVAMKKMKESKRRAYLRGLKSHQIFKPVAFETLGAWDEEAVALLKRITSSLARNQGKDEAETNRFLVQRVAIAIQRGNAVSLADRLRGEVGEEGDAQE